MDPSYHYMTYDLNPFIFELKNINFDWVFSWWGILLILIFCIGLPLFVKFKLDGFKKQNLLEKTALTESNPLFHKISRYELLLTTLVYLISIFVILFGLQKAHVNWGLRWYSTMYLIAFISVYIGCMHWIKAKAIMLTENLLVALITYCVVGLLIGARVAYVFIYNWSYYKLHPWEAIATWEGGLSFHGGAVGIALALVYFCKKNKVPFLHIGDKLVRIIPIGIGVGRIGNFLNGELWGRPIANHVPWAIIFPASGDNLPRHPSQIYQSLGEGWGLFLTLYIISRWKQREGTLISCFFIFYCIYRFVVEYFREADIQVSYFYLGSFTWDKLNIQQQTPWWQILTMGQILCVIFFFAGLLFLFLTRKNIKEGSPEWIKRNSDFFLKHQQKD